MNKNMKNGRICNAKVKYKYREYLKEVRGLSERTIIKKEASISLLEEKLQGCDFRVFNRQIALAIKRNLLTKQSNLSIRTINFHIDSFKGFLDWLSEIPGYKRYIKKTNIGYLNLDRNTVRALRTDAKVEELPTADDVKAQINAIEKTTDVGWRNRGIFACLYLSGVRIDTLISLPINVYDPEKRLLYLEKDRGVRVKFGYQGITKLIAPDPTIEDELKGYRNYLITTKKFHSTAPLFPKTRQLSTHQYHPFGNSNISTEFWKSDSSCRKMIKQQAKQSGLGYFRPHSYRHAAILRAVEMASNPTELKAVSKNFLHNDIMTTLVTYGKIPNRDQLKIISDMEKRKENINDDILTPLLQVIAQSPELVKRFKKMANI